MGEKGYSPRNDLAMAITNVNLEGYNRSYNYYFTLVHPAAALFRFV